MATYKVKATMILDIEVDVDADSEEHAISKFIQMDARDAIDDGHIMDVNTENETAEISEADYKVRVFNIDYDISEEDVDEFISNEYGLESGMTDYDEAVEAEIRHIRNELPKEMIVELKYCEPEDVESEAIDKVSDKTGWLINSADIEILEMK